MKIQTPDANINKTPNARFDVFGGLAGDLKHAPKPLTRIHNKGDGKGKGWDMGEEGKVHCVSE